MIGLIGGTGLRKIDGLNITREPLVDTPYGKPSDKILVGKLEDRDVAFLARHGEGHTIPPHLINYRANIYALENLGVKAILGIATVGSISSVIQPGSIVLPHQVIDYTYGREHTYFDGVKNPVSHIDFTYPYNPNLRKLLCLLCKNTSLKNINFFKEGVYAAVQGPRLETAAEIDKYERDGSSIVGMTGMPEASLAREVNLPYAAICPVANFAAGRASSKEGITHEEINKQSEIMSLNVSKYLKVVIQAYGN
ncbi:S-methyl-5'-thioinosine phosphorylase [Methylophilaceae bacterium]|nr:S-methyl-5'-thioinosine phosphorylase [Methylophilaceae bacterium]